MTRAQQTAFMHGYLEKSGSIVQNGIRFFSRAGLGTSTLKPSQFEFIERSKSWNPVNRMFLKALKMAGGEKALAKIRDASMLEDIQPGTGLAGVAATGGKVVALADAKAFTPMQRRSVIAHEAFHANNPQIGKYELLARLYGGYKSQKSSSLFSRLKASADEGRDYISSFKNPEFAKHYPKSPFQNETVRRLFV